MGFWKKKNLSQSLLTASMSPRFVPEVPSESHHLAVMRCRSEATSRSLRLHRLQAQSTLAFRR
jgi:hypothetical protein